MCFCDGDARSGARGCRAAPNSPKTDAGNDTSIGPRALCNAQQNLLFHKYFCDVNVLDKICAAGLRYQCARIQRRVPPLEISAWRWRGYTHRVRLQPSVSLIVAADYLGDTPRLFFRCSVSCVARQEIESAIWATEKSMAEEEFNVS